MLKLELRRRDKPLGRYSFILPVALPIIFFLAYLPLLAAYGVSPLDALVESARVLANPGEIVRSFLRGLPILFPALGLAIVFRMSFWNIGAEGQLLMGLLIGSGTAIYVASGLPRSLLLLVSLAAAFAAGALWALPPALLRGFLGVNEVLSTLMLNYVATAIFNYMVEGPWRSTSSYGFIISPPLPDRARIGVIGSLALAALASIIIYVLMNHTKLGYEIKIVGSSYEAARHSGISYVRVAAVSMAICGGLAGIGGFMISSCMTGVLMEAQRMSPGYGYTAIIAAWLARLNPMIVPLASFFLGYVVELGDYFKLLYRLPSSSVMVLEGMLLLGVVLSEFIEKYTVMVRRSGRS